MNLFQRIQSRYRNVIVHQHPKPIIVVLPSNENMKVKKRLRKAGKIVGKGVEAKLVFFRKTVTLLARRKKAA